MPREFDSPWKDALDEFLEAALEMFHPRLHAVVDWTIAYENLDAELSSVVREAELGETVADRLFRVTLRDGERIQVLIHAEVQSQHDTSLPRRMFVYHYRLLDRYAEPPVSLAILGDESTTWRPSEYNYDIFGTATTFRFRTVKLVDWRERYEELLTGSNPIGVVIAAHLRSLDTHGQPVERSRAKWQLFRSLFGRDWSPERIRRMYRLIDWLLELPPDLELQHKADALAYEQEHKMPYVTSIERLAKEEGRLGGLLDGAEYSLRMKFGAAGQRFAEQLRNPPRTLIQIEKILQSLESCESIAELQACLAESDGNVDPVK